MPSKDYKSKKSSTQEANERVSNNNGQILLVWSYLCTEQYWIRQN